VGIIQSTEVQGKYTAWLSMQTQGDLQCLLRYMLYLYEDLDKRTTCQITFAIMEGVVVYSIA
jgi:hypothetical protein